MYSNIRSRAGLVALVLALISISLVSALPIPVSSSQSELSSTFSPSSSNPSHDGQNHIQHEIRRSAKFSVNGQMSQAPAPLSSKHNAMNTDDNQLVRRNIFSKIKKGFQNLGHDIKHVAQKVGSGIKKAAQTVGSGIKKAAQTVGSGIKKAAKTVGSGIRTAAKSVGHFVKTTGAKIAKFGLKVVQSVGMAIGDVASFIPEVGKGVQQAINGVSKVAGVVSDHIHANLGKLGKGMNVMNKANKIMGYLRRELSDEEAFQQRDISKTYYSGPGEANLDETLEHSYLDNDYDLDNEDWE